MSKVKCKCDVCKKDYFVFKCRLPTKYCSHRCQTIKRIKYLRKTIRSYSVIEKRELLKDRILKRISKVDECWIWNGCLNRGYGDMTFLGESISVHRAAYFAWKGKIPSGKFICHKCDLPACCNPDHLFIGDAASNRKDAFDKGRFNSCIGENHYYSKLKNKDVEKMKRLFDGDIPMKMIAKIFGVTVSTVESIKYRRSWKHI